MAPAGYGSVPAMVSGQSEETEIIKRKEKLFTLCNETRRFETDVFGAPPKVLQEKYRSDPTSTFFLELEFVKLDVFSRGFGGISRVKQ